MAMSEERTVLCGANAYDKKYYYNEAFAQIPKSIQDELHIICVLFTEEIGGIFTIEFERDGGISLEPDICYDEIGSGLLVKEIYRKRKELFRTLSMYYRVLILKEDMADLLEEDE